MGLFSKETCVFCGKEVGMMHRSKMQGGDYICTDCKYLTHPFIRIDHVNKDEAAAIMEEVARDEAYFQTVQWRQTSRFAGGDKFIFYDNYETGEFAFYTPETKKYKNHPVFRMDLVRPFDRSKQFFLDQGDTRALEPLTKAQYMSMITLEQKKGADGKLEGWILKMPYFRDKMDIEIKFPATMKEADVKYIHSSIQSIISNYNTSETRDMYKKMDMQRTNAMQTASGMLKAAIKGEGTEGVAEALKEGMETAEDINAGKVKRGLFGRLKK